MSILTYPDLPSGQVPTMVVFSLVPNTQAFTSPLNGSVQTLELPGARWQFSIQYPGTLDQADRLALKAFLAKLRGAAGRFYMWDHSHKAPAGAATGVPVVSGAGQAGGTLNTSGWTPSVTGILKAGDYFQVGQELKILTANANSDGSGNATLTFESPLRAAPANGASIITTRASAIFMLKDDQQDQFQVAPGQWSSITIEGVEAFS